MKAKQIAIALLGATVIAVSADKAAQASYGHRWECERQAGNHCTDTAGKAYNPWVSIDVQAWGFHIPGSMRLEPYIVDWICVGARTRKGSERTIDRQGCKYNDYQWRGTLASKPKSQAYTYWSGRTGLLDPNKLMLKSHAKTD